MFMNSMMTLRTKSFPVRNLVSQLWICGKWFNVMRMQIYCLTIATMSTTILTGKIISFKNRISPFGIFSTHAGQLIGMRFRNVSCSAGLLSLIGLFRCSWMQDFSTSIRTCYSQFSSLAIFRHYRITNWTPRLEFLTIRTHLVRYLGLIGLLIADSTSYSRPTKISSSRRSARNTSIALCHPSSSGYRRCGFSADSTRLAMSIVAFPTYTIVGFCTAYFTTPFQLSHTSNLAKLPA